MAKVGANPIWQILDETGAAIDEDGVDLYFYEPGTTTEKTVWKDTGEATAWTQPVVTDSAGRFSSPICFKGIYDVKVVYGDGSTKTISNWGDNNSAPAATGLTNLVLNASAETDDNSDGAPDNWTNDSVSGATYSRDATDSNHGVASFKIVTTTTANATYASAFFEVSPSTKYVTAFHVKAGGASNNAVVLVRWYDRNQSLLSTSTVYNNSTTTPTSWTLVQGLTVSSPASAVYAKYHIRNGSTSATIRFDGIEFSRAGTTISPWTRRGLVVTNNGTDADHDLDISAGEVRDSTNAYNIIITSALTKQCDATWAAGTNAGCMQSGSSLTADGLFYVYAIFNPTTGASDVLVSTSATSPTLPSGYTAYRRIWSFLTNSSSNIRAYTPSGNYLRLHDPFNDVNDSTVADNTYEEYTLSCPPQALAHIYGRTYNTTSQSLYLFIRTKGANDGPGTYSTEHSWLGVGDGSSGTNTNNTKEGFILVDSNRKIEAAPDEVGGTSVVSIIILGYLDLGLDA